VIGLVANGFRGRRTVVTMRNALVELEPDPEPEAVGFPRSHVALPILMRRRNGVLRERNIEFRRVAGRRLRLDVYARVDARPGDGRPALLYIHGGAWVIGDKREQGLPLINHLAANGWVVFTANYRLSPAATFPDHLIDAKAALAWIREHGAEFGADPEWVCVSGNSAGGHLAALVGLTANDPEYQPGFEHVDTSVRAAVPFYGVYDFTNRHGVMDDQFITRFLEPIVMKRFFAEEPHEFVKASPLDRVHADVPPFLVIHGDRDSLTPVSDARLFVERLRAASRQPVLYAEMRGAQHAFDVFPSIRTAKVIEGVERFLTTIWRRREQAPAAVEADLQDALTE
jgi:acetyl esterase/lipase